MVNLRKMAGSIAHYDGVLSRPFLAEHWYRGLVAAIVSLFLLLLLLASVFDLELCAAALIAAPLSLLLFTAAVMQHERFELDANKLRYRSCLWVLGLRFGRWYSLPAISAIIVRHRPHRHFLPLKDSSTTQVGFIATEDKHQVLLCVADSPVGILVAYVPQSQALATATTLGKLLGVDMMVE